MTLTECIAEHVAGGCSESGRSLGRVKMPEGYALMCDHDDMYFYWVCHDGRESFVHHDKWAIYRGARADYRMRTERAQKPELSTDTNENKESA